MQNRRNPTGGRAPSKQARRRRNRRRQATNRLPLIRSPANLSQCASDYLMALSDPWNANDPCIPDVITIPSQKYTTRGRGTFVIGPNGVGFVAASFQNAVKNDGSYGVSITDFPIVTTTAAYALTNYSWLIAAGAPTAGVIGSNVSGPFAGAYFANPQNSAQYRIVGGGLKIRYAGTQLQMGGRAVVYRPRSNRKVPGSNDGLNSTVGSLLNDLAYESSPVDRSWKQVTFIPDDTQYLSYQSYNTPINSGDQATGPFTMIGLVEGGSFAQVFEYDAIFHYELVGTGVSVTHSASDAVGYAAVLSSIPSEIPSKAGEMLKEMKTGTFDYIYNAGRDVLSNVATTVAGGAVAGVTTAYGLNRARRRRITGI